MTGLPTLFETSLWQNCDKGVINKVVELLVLITKILEIVIQLKKEKQIQRERERESQRERERESEKREG